MADGQRQEPAAWSLRAGVSVAAITVGVACLVVIALRYPSLPDTLPVSRWSTTEKSPIVALRVPAINLLITVGLATLWRVAARTDGFPRSAGVALLAASATKSIGATIEMLLLPDRYRALSFVVVATAVSAVAAAAVAGRSWLTTRSWRALDWRRSERVIALTAIAGVVALNLPLARW